MLTKEQLAGMADDLARDVEELQAKYIAAPILAALERVQRETAEECARFAYRETLNCVTRGGHNSRSAIGDFALDVADILKDRIAHLPDDIDTDPATGTADDAVLQAAYRQMLDAQRVYLNANADFIVAVRRVDRSVKTKDDALIALSRMEEPRG